MGIFKIEGGILKEKSRHKAKMKHYKFYVLFFNSEKVIINNIPDIIDINKLITLLGNLGVKIQKRDLALILSS
jgi:UDP-N-acetylglucosamine 1-carboxyvinyltransferase